MGRDSDARGADLLKIPDKPIPSSGSLPQAEEPGIDGTVVTSFLGK